MALVLSNHYRCTEKLNAFEEIMALFNDNIPLLPPGQYMRPLAQGTVAELFISQSIGGDSSPSDGLVEAINHFRAILNYYPPGTQHRPMALFVLSLLLRQRHRAFGDEECLKEAELCVKEA